MYGLCDLGFGHPVLGYARLIDLQSMTVRVLPRDSVGIGLKRRLYFKPIYSLSAYVEAAGQNGANR